MLSYLSDIMAFSFFDQHNLGVNSSFFGYRDKLVLNKLFSLTPQRLFASNGIISRVIQGPGSRSFTQSRDDVQNNHGIARSVKITQSPIKRSYRVLKIIIKIKNMVTTLVDISTRLKTSNSKMKGASKVSKTRVV